MVSDKNSFFDLCVIGCGPGGFAGAMRGFDLGKDVCIVEGNRLGGAGVQWGALASKTMWELAKDYAIATKVDRGYRATGLTVDFQSVRSTVMRAVKEKQYQMRSQIETFSPGRWQGPGSLTLKQGWARFISPESIQIDFPDGSRETVSARYFLIATGSHPRQIPGITVDQQRIFDSDGILNLESFPKRLVIIGAGIIGCEYATIFSNFGQTEVCLVDHMERVIPFEDDDVSDFVSANLRGRGVRIIHSAVVRQIQPRSNQLEVVLDFAAGHSEVVEADAVLISIGRVADLASLNPVCIGLGDGRPEVDEHCRIKDHIYAAGDVTHHPSLVNLAEMEARHAVNHMFGIRQRPLSYHNMSTIMFFYPAVAAVGLNEKGCRKRNIAHRVATYSNKLLPRAIAMRALNGFVKIIVEDHPNGRILGMRAAGPQVSSTIVSIAHFMDLGKGVHDVLKSVFPHPTISEGIQECLRLLIGESIYKPRAFPDDISIRIWRPE